MISCGGHLSEESVISDGLNPPSPTFIKKKKLFININREKYSKKLHLAPGDFLN